MIFYVTVILRSECLIVSFHESEDMDDVTTSAESGFPAPPLRRAQ
jgi:hypothetical protein